ncbi:hypothetical protein GW17_00023180 [Ensete ventricosum]|nr:hypothetical protein GW17_00023180 [Ensete ventricosum]
MSMSIFSIAAHQTHVAETIHRILPKRNCTRVPNALTAAFTSEKNTAHTIMHVKHHVDHGQSRASLPSLTGGQHCVLFPLQRVEVVDNSYFITEENMSMLKRAKEANSIMYDYRVPAPGVGSASAGLESAKVENGLLMSGLPVSVYAPETVGCVVVDSNGWCAAATSTGGLVNKMSGRIGDSPLIGSGTYACADCAVSCTGEGEAIIRSTLARDVAALVEYKGLSLQEAVDHAIRERLDEGMAGLIAVSRNGEVAYGFNTIGMFRGCATEDGFMEVSIW